MTLTELLPEVQQLSVHDKLKLICLLTEELDPPVDERSLTELLDGITEDNLHREIEVGTAVGNEAW